MFVDYYSLFEIDETATNHEIKKAFRKQAIKWHPDRNPGKDTTKQMQLLNEAYLILKDNEARNRFDIEYQKFKIYQQEQNEREELAKAKENHFNQQQAEGKKAEQRTEQENEAPKYEYQEYSVKDDILKRWMSNAKRQAVDLAKETIKEFGNIAAVGIKEGAKAAGKGLIFQFIIGIIFLIIFSIYKSCN